MINKAKLCPHCLSYGGECCIARACSIANREPAEHCCSAVSFRPANGADFSEFAATVRFRPWWCRDFPGPCGKLRP